MPKGVPTRLLERSGITGGTQSGCGRGVDAAEQLNGDEVRAHAIVENAVEAGDQETVEAFQAAYPALAEATARLWNAATHRQTTADIATAWRLSALKPAALASRMDYEIAALAAGR